MEFDEIYSKQMLLTHGIQSMVKNSYDTHILRQTADLYECDLEDLPYRLLSITKGTISEFEKQNPIIPLISAVVAMCDLVNFALTQPHYTKLKDLKDKYFGISLNNSTFEQFQKDCVKSKLFRKNPGSNILINSDGTIYLPENEGKLFLKQMLYFMMFSLMGEDYRSVLFDKFTKDKFSFNESVYYQKPLNYLSYIIIADLINIPLINKIGIVLNAEELIRYNCVTLPYKDAKRKIIYKDPETDKIYTDIFKEDTIKYLISNDLLDTLEIKDNHIYFEGKKMYQG